ncbi:MAG TPA: carbon monoxide dehydrogenase subunit G [Nocardioidaceae bacterium]|nr:carbon monoxide dehydrogenase subunit G [Nocardioidaceae bacterium]
MKISGTSTLNADRTTVWAALNDPAVLVQAIPGCQRLEALGADSFKMTVAAGVGSIKGVYDGEVRLTEHQHPDSFTMLAQGAGAPGTIGAQVWVNLIEGPDGKTELKYDADATVGGMIGGVGQRMLTGVSRKMADEFFRNVDAVLVGGVPGAAPVAPAGVPGLAAGPAAVGAAPGPVAAPAVGPQVGQVFTAPQAAAAAPTGPGFLLGVVAGAAAALAGAVVGGWLAGRRRS